MEPKSCLPKSPPPVKPSLSGNNFRNSDEEWYSEYEDDLLDVWHIVKDNIEQRGIVMLDKCRFSHFCAFVMSMTTTSRDRCI
jgi:hypothetical protein